MYVHIEQTVGIYEHIETESLINRTLERMVERRLERQIDPSSTRRNGKNGKDSKTAPRHRKSSFKRRGNSDKKTCKRTARQTDKQTDKDRQTDSQTGRQSTYEHADKQADRETERERER